VESGGSDTGLAAISQAYFFESFDSSCNIVDYRGKDESFRK
jgi:hypothetical protein